MSSCRMLLTLACAVASLDVSLAEPPSESSAGPRDPPAEADRLFEEAESLRFKGALTEAVAVAQKALGLREKALGPDHPQTAADIDHLAALTQEAGDLAAARPLYERALAIREHVLGPEHPDVGESLDHLGYLLQDLGEHAAARPLYERALRVIENALGPHSPRVAEVLVHLGKLLRTLGDYQAARPLYDRALGICEKAFGPDHPKVASVLTDIARLLKTLGDLKGARPLYERALAINEAAFGPEHPDLLTVLNSLGLLLKASGELATARTVLERALRISEKAFGPEHQNTATLLNNLALLLVDLGDLKAARPLHERDLAITEARYGADHLNTATSLDNLGVLLRNLGDPKAARPLHERALAIREGTLGPEHPSTGKTLNNLALVLTDLGEPERARSLFERDLAITEKTLGPDHPQLATSLNNLAVLISDLGDPLAARALHERALAIREKALGPNHPDVAISLGNLGVLEQALGHLDAARSLLQRALAVCEKGLGQDHPETAVALNDLASHYESAGDPRAARPLFERALEIEEHQLAALMTMGTEAEKQSFMTTLRQSTSRAIALSLRHGPADPRYLTLGLESVLRRKARVLEATADQLASLRRDLDVEDRPLLDALGEARRRLGTLTLRPPGDLDAEALIRGRDKARADVARIETLLSRKSEAFAVAQSPISITAVRRPLSPRSALVELVVFEAAAPAPPEARYAAYILPARGAPMAVELGSADVIDKAAAGLVAAIANRRLDAAAKARTVHDLVFAKLLPHLAGIDTLLIAPDGGLAQLPFEALRSPDGKWLIESFHISYLAAGRDLLQLRRPRAPASPPLILADIAYGVDTKTPTDMALPTTRSSDPAFETLRWSPLPGTAREANGLAALPLFRGVRLLLQENASEAALRATPHPRILHIATHGFFLTDLPHHSSPGLGSRSAPSARGGQENPLLRSGLALSGANARRTRVDLDDGVLTALEVIDLDLRGTELVVLSACETGVGDASRGDGVFGLRRALTLAGARAQVMSLWKVDDAATESMMLDYYARLARGEPRAEALRQVKLSMMRDPSTASTHPYFWASFVVSGDGSALPREAPKVVIPRTGR